MKLKSKAGVPIGTIAIIIIVLVATFGMYWYFTQDGKDCSDVKGWCDAADIDGNCLHHSYHIKHGASIEYVKIQWWETLAGDQYRVVAYIQSSGYITTFLWFYDLDELNDWFESHGSFSEIQKNDTVRMVECLKAGCPSCQVG